MPRFEPFPALRYDSSLVDLEVVTAPPYDVISRSARDALAARSPHNVVHVDVVDHDPDGYNRARQRFAQWQASGILRTDPEPNFYVYRMGYTDESGQPRQTVGVVGAMELSVPGERDVLPHERTLPKAKDDRLRLMEACQANLSPVWCLSMADGLSALCAIDSPPIARFTDQDGVHHRLWRITRPGVLEAISAVVGSAPVVIADGHHRYETALTFRDQQRRARGDTAETSADLIMTLVVELGDGQLGVRPIHRLVHTYSGMSIAPDPGGAPSQGPSGYSLAPIDVALDLSSEASLNSQPGPVLVTTEGSWIVRADDNGARSPDSVTIESFLAALEPHTLSYDHRASEVLAAVTEGRAQGGLLLRPIDVDQIAAAAGAGKRLPEKSSFFFPKPRTGMLFRALT